MLTTSEKSGSKKQHSDTQLLDFSNIESVYQSVMHTFFLGEKQNNTKTSCLSQCQDDGHHGR